MTSVSLTKKTYILYNNDNNLNNFYEEDNMFSFFKKKKKNTADAYAKGKFVPITEVPDPIFSEKMMGDGVAILVEGDTIYSPVDAKITMIAPTFHAIGLTLDSGMELLIHIGLETVALNGDGFTPLVKANDTVTKGTPLMKIDLETMKKNNLELYTPLIVLNYQDHPFTDIHKSEEVNVGDPLIQID